MQVRLTGLEFRFEVIKSLGFRVSDVGFTSRSFYHIPRKVQQPAGSVILMIGLSRISCVWY